MYKTHVQSFGWQTWKTNGQMSGTSGKAKRLEGINIKLSNASYSGGVRYTTHVQSYGWQGNENDPNTWRNDGEMSGTSGQAKRLEAIRISLYGEMAEHYDIYYRVHAQSFGWLSWAKTEKHPELPDWQKDWKVYKSYWFQRDLRNPEEHTIT